MRTVRRMDFDMEAADRKPGIHQTNFVLLVSIGCYLLIAYVNRYIPLIADLPLIRLVDSEIALLVPPFLFMAIRRIPWKDFTDFCEPDGFSLRMAFTVMVCAYPLVMIINLITMSKIHNIVGDVMPKLTQYGLPVCMLVLAVLPAFAEELLFRGFLYHSYRRYSVVGAAIISGAAFALMHMSFSQIPYALFLGILFALMDEASGSVGTSIFMHFMLNATTVALSFYTPPAQGTASQAAAQSVNVQDMISRMMDPEGLMIMAVMSAGLLGLIVYLVRRTLDNSGRTLRTKESQGSVFSILDIWLIIFVGITIYYALESVVFV